MSLTVAIQMDPIEKIDIGGDSTFALALEAQARGHALLYYGPRDLSFRDGKVTARVRPLKVRAVKGDHFTLGEAFVYDLSAADVVLMRQDPPFDMAYITTTHLLERIHPKTLVVNDPREVRNAPEKLFVTEFKDLMPPTLITTDPREIRAFRDEPQGHHPQAALRQWRGRRFPPQAGRREFRRAARDVHRILSRADHGAALSARGAPGRQAHHPGRRRIRRRHQPRSGRAARPAPTCMSAAGRSKRS